MSHGNYFEALDKILKDVMTCLGLQDTIFCGKVVVFGGDFRQILHIVPRGGRSDIVHASISPSYICESDDGLVDIAVPQELLILNFDDSIRVIVDSTYPNLLENYKEEFLHCRAILASTIEVVDKINHYVLDLIPGKEKEYLSSDSIDRMKVNYNETYEVLTSEFLSKLRTSGLPNHRIKLKNNGWWIILAYTICNYVNVN
ncbi:uncharacterized protein LOC131605674 [Vicia villosa]|uniref:uncharacterized protein LOC131605674 n=1 Tax=Vicia villosa TaxID=3911 RepID=UPI00273A8533|nr:uncharacterized protein LOC131605674 [Vicia villosa]